VATQVGSLPTLFRLTFDNGRFEVDSSLQLLRLYGGGQLYLEVALCCRSETTLPAHADLYAITWFFVPKG